MIRALREGRRLPPFVEQTSRDFLQCGLLAGGVARFRCADCGLSRLRPFSCQGRAVYLDRRGAHAVHDMDVVGPTLQPASGRRRVLGSALGGVETGNALLQVAEGSVSGATMCCANGGHDRQLRRLRRTWR